MKKEKLTIDPTAFHKKVKQNLPLSYMFSWINCLSLTSNFFLRFYLSVGKIFKNTKKQTKDPLLAHYESLVNRATNQGQNLGTYSRPSPFLKIPISSMTWNSFPFTIPVLLPETFLLGEWPPYPIHSISNAHNSLLTPQKCFRKNHLSKKKNDHIANFYSSFNNIQIKLSSS